MKPANEIRSQGCKSPIGFMEVGCSIVYVFSFGSSVVDSFTPNWAYTSSTMLQDFMEQSTAVIPLLCSPASCSSLLEFATCSALLRRVLLLTPYRSRELRITSHSSTETSSGV
ncbi:uncharacterized protein LOC107608048 isoform X2 [Arachis ipaensis]|uniref:uncharacterized protein LOC107608048 isoform X2 n=1 Tax=Arachis ipaensis TaxID=130454 RepID=UPI0007AFC379|nr:uncharacterized protein LOC107608048 isoform X2 [Arachis ipaensis]